MIAFRYPSWDIVSAYCLLDVRGHIKSLCRVTFACQHSLLTTGGSIIEGEVCGYIGVDYCPGCSRIAP